jgi:hypothetical protein
VEAADTLDDSVIDLVGTADTLDDSAIGMTETANTRADSVIDMVETADTRADSAIAMAETANTRDDSGIDLSDMVNKPHGSVIGNSESLHYRASHHLPLSRCGGRSKRAAICGCQTQSLRFRARSGRHASCHGICHAWVMLHCTPD